MSAVNFSDRTTKRLDSHQWHEIEAELRAKTTRSANGYRHLCTVKVFECLRCGEVLMLPPELNHDLPSCIPSVCGGLIVGGFCCNCQRAQDYGDRCERAV